MIWLLRHADAAKGSPDAGRPLTDRGRRQARAVGLALARLDVELDACVSSPKLRAHDTALLACEALGPEVVIDERLEAGPFDAREVAGSYGEHVLLVGHDPDFSLAVNHLTGAQVRLAKGGIACEDRGELKLLLQPPVLSALAPAD